MAGWYKYTTETLFMGKSPGAEKVSAHYCISKKGEITQMVQEGDTAYHVGRKANGMSIGIEMEDGGDAKGGFCLRNGDWLTPELWNAAVHLAADICKRNKIPVSKIIGHNDPIMQKLGNCHADPGPFFPMAKFRAEVQELIGA